VGDCIKLLYIVTQIDKIYMLKISISCISERRLAVFRRGALYEKKRRDKNLLKIFNSPKRNDFNSS
jgi:hypothetical protein